MITNTSREGNRDSTSLFNTSFIYFLMKIYLKFYKINYGWKQSGLYRAGPQTGPHPNMASVRHGPTRPTDFLEAYGPHFIWLLLYYYLLFIYEDTLSLSKCLRVYSWGVPMQFYHRDSGVARRHRATPLHFDRESELSIEMSAHSSAALA